MAISVKDGDILFIDRHIKDVLKKEIDTIDVLYAEQERLKLLSTTGSQKDRISSIYQLAELKIKIQDISTFSKLAVYLYYSRPLIEEYKRLFGKKKFIKSGNTDKKKKEDITRAFIIIAREYIPIENYTQHHTHIDICKNCGSNLITDIDIGVCRSCGIEYRDMTETLSFKDGNRLNMIKRYKYTKKGHFLHAMKTFQGKQKVISERIEADIAYILLQMKLHDLDPKNTTKDHIHMFISERKSMLSSKKEKSIQFKYEDLNLIYSRITNVPCPDIDMISDKLLEDFEKQEEAISIVDPYRIHSLNVNFKLMMLLRKNGMYYTKYDFYILKIDEKEQEHNDILSRAWEYLGWEWIP